MNTADNGSIESGKKTQLLELLAPAGNHDIGVAAIEHGADAVYVGAPRFSARAEAGVDIGSIARLVRRAHLFHAKVYVALNTILLDEEIPQALEIIRQVYEIGADGLIIQDVGLLEANLPPIPLIASTQMHNDTLEKILFLEQLGFKRVILARELSLAEIASIRKETRIELECFVHGALCVSYSGQCYMSHAVTGRSGNRGVCAQPCRFRYTLRDAENGDVLGPKYLLSLRDLNLLGSLPDLVAAGVTSFKIEGRYKEIDYVKNVTAAYSQALDSFIESNPSYRRAASGRCEVKFIPDPERTFNRGFTSYFIMGRTQKIGSPNTPKSIGKETGSVIKVGRGWFQADCNGLNNGDGLCFFAGDGELLGFRVERVEGPKIYASETKGLKKGTRLYRNHDIAFSRLLNAESSRRRIRVRMECRRFGHAVALDVTDEDGITVRLIRKASFQEAKNVRMALNQMEKHLARAGNTPFEVLDVNIAPNMGFLPVSFLNGLRRDALGMLAGARLGSHPRETIERIPSSFPYPRRTLDYHANVANALARRFYQNHGAEVLEPAFELLPEKVGKEVMRTRYCLRYELDACPRYGLTKRQLKEPLRLCDGHHSYMLQFDCDSCRMSVIFLGKLRGSAGGC